MDNAKYHNILADDTFPTPRSRKHELQDWLRQNRPDLDLHDDPTRLKPELYQKCKKEAPPPEFKLDQIAKSHGHTILRTPQYHPELQPIETCWGIVKSHCRNHCDFSMEALNKELKVGFSKVKAKTCQGLIRKAREQEDLFWKQDSEVDAQKTSEEIKTADNYINSEDDDDDDFL